MCVDGSTPNMTVVILHGISRGVFEHHTTYLTCMFCCLKDKFVVHSCFALHHDHRPKSEIEIPPQFKGVKPKLITNRVTVKANTVTCCLSTTTLSTKPLHFSVFQWTRSLLYVRNNIMIWTICQNPQPTIFSYINFIRLM